MLWVLAIVIVYPDIGGKYDAFKISAGSSFPTLRIGDHIIASLYHYDRHPLNRGDIVVLADGVTDVRQSWFWRAALY